MTEDKMKGRANDRLRLVEIAHSCYLDIIFFICLTVLNVVDKEAFTVKKVLAAYNYSARQNKSQRKLLVLKWYRVNSLVII